MGDSQTCVEQSRLRTGRTLLCTVGISIVYIRAQNGTGGDSVVRLWTRRYTVMAPAARAVLGELLRA